MIINFRVFSPYKYFGQFIYLKVHNSQILTILYCRSRKSRSIDWHGVWWLVILLFTPVLHASIKLLDCPHLEGESPFTLRWFVNANIKCFRDAQHAPLGLFALAVLIASVALIITLLLMATQRLTRPYWVRHMVVPLTLPFKKSREWWCAVELGKRTVLIVFAVGVRGNSVLLALILVLLLSLNGYFKPFKSDLVNVLDMVYSINVFVLLCLRSTPDIEINLKPTLVKETTSSSSCSTDIEYTPFVILLGILYYFPLVIAVATLVSYIGFRLLSYIRKDIVPMMEKNSEGSVDKLPTSAKVATPDRQRTRTQTFVDISNCEPASPSPVVVQKKQFSFKIKKPSLRFGSRKRKKEEKGEKNSFSPGLPDIPMEKLNKTSTEVKVELEPVVITDLDSPMH